MIAQLTMHLNIMGDASSVMQAYIAPIIRTMAALAGIVSVFFLVNGSMTYMTSAGKPENLDHAKTVIRNALIGLVIVLAAGVLTQILTHAYASGAVTSQYKLPNLTAIPPAPVSNGLVEVVIKAITGVLNNIIQAIAAPFLAALAVFTKSTPLMADNSTVFNLWLAIVGIADALFVLIIALIGFQVMSFTSFGFEEVDLKSLLPRVSLIFLLMNVSIFLIDGVIELSNAMIHALNLAGTTGTVWDVLTAVVKQSGGQGVAALLIMLAFLILSVILLIYYLGRLVTLYIGATLSPLLLILWLVPGFRDFSESAAKTYLTTIFVLFVHVVILEIAASLFVGLTLGSPGHLPDTLMAMAVGLATLIALLKTQGVMMQLSYVSMGSRNARKLGKQFIHGISYSATTTKKAVTVIKKRRSGSDEDSGGNQPDDRSKGNNNNQNSNRRPRSNNYRPQEAKTGTTTVAPKQNNKSSSASNEKKMEKTS